MLDTYISTDSLLMPKKPIRGLLFRAIHAGYGSLDMLYGLVSNVHIGLRCPILVLARSAKYAYKSFQAADVQGREG